MILGRERIDASIDADVANKEFRALDEVCHLINLSPAETTCGSCHRRAPSPPSERYLEFGSQIRKWPSFDFGRGHWILGHHNKEDAICDRPVVPGESHLEGKAPLAVHWTHRAWV